MPIVSSQKGIVLLLVLWVLTILMVVVLSFSFTTRTETLSTLAFKERTQEKFLAEGGLHRGIMELYYLNANRTMNVPLEGMEVWKTDGTFYTGQIGSGNYAVRIMDETGKIDINMVPDVVLKSFLLNFGVQEEQANIIVDSVMDWKDADEDTRLNGAESAYYMSLSTPYHSKNANFDTVEELLLVRGITPTLLYGDKTQKGIIDFLTVNSFVNKINIAAAPKEVLMAVPGMTSEIADSIISARQGQGQALTQNIQGAIGGSYQAMAQYVSLAGANTYTIDAIGYQADRKKGYAIRATVLLNRDSTYSFVYYKSPAEINQ
ncbi:MAG: general secretion pathway protein GspK [Dissulfurispiraceae bacterium]